MSIFISFSSKDRKYVSEFILEAKKRKIPVWAALERNKSSGKDFLKLITKKIERSYGCIVLISKNSLNSEFINNIELPKVLNRSQKSRGYKVIPVLIDDSDISNHPVFSKIELINSQSTKLESLSGKQYELKIKETISEFTYIFKKIIFKYFLINSIIFLGLFTIYKNLNTNYTENELIFLNSMSTPEVIAEIGNGSLIPDEDLLAIGYGVCNRFENKIEPFIVYDFVYFNTAMTLDKLEVVGKVADFTQYNMTALVKNIFNNSNSFLCSFEQNTFQAFEKFVVFQYVSLTYEFQSDLYFYLFRENYFNNQEIIYYGEISEDILTENSYRNTFIELWAAGCEIFLENPTNSINIIQEMFLDVETLEDQNIVMDEIQIITTIIPLAFCPEFQNNATILNNELKNLNYIYNPGF